MLKIKYNMNFEFLRINKKESVVVRLEKEKYNDEEKIKELINEVKSYLTNIEDKSLESLVKKKGVDKVLTSSEAFKFLRSLERIDNTKLILQYLIKFIEDLPVKEDLKKEFENPFIQFKGFVENCVNLLKSDDVIFAILREHIRAGLINEKNINDYKRRIDKIYLEITEILKTIKEPCIMNYKKLLVILINFSKLWFMVRNENLKYVRKSDIYIYKLSNIILSKYNLN